ncbi:trypsin-like peptidase domain-containing protein [Mycoplasmatota bacterium]|nr:trypsin-like peptidase domain-containing protein [Mycoplasmatota bacterium]
MKKLFLVITIALILTGCSIPIETEVSSNTTTTDNLAQLSEEDLNNIKQQIMDELRQEIQNEYSQHLTETEIMIINSVKANARAVLGVSNFKLTEDVYNEASSGSGVIYKHTLDKNEYYMITNEHVVKDADKLSVVLADNTYIDAELIGADAITDLAVIKFTSSVSFPVVEIADSDELQIGQFAIAIGNPLGYEYYGSVTSGIVSGLSRDMAIDYDEDHVIDWYATLIQHDAAISPGNSGGGLFDISGKLIGINNMKIVENTVSNIGFAIPSNTVKYIINQLELNGEVERPSLGIIGSGVANIIQNNNNIEAGVYVGEIVELPEGITTGVLVSSIVDNSSASNSGLQEGDIILKYNDVEIITFDDLRLQLANAKVGDQVTLTVYRNGDSIPITLTLKQRPNV